MTATLCPFCPTHFCPFFCKRNSQLGTPTWYVPTIRTI